MSLACLEAGISLISPLVLLLPTWPLSSTWMHGLLKKAKNPTSYYPTTVCAITARILSLVLWRIIPALLIAYAAADLLFQFAIVATMSLNAILSIPTSTNQTPLISMAKLSSFLGLTSMLWALQYAR